MRAQTLPIHSPQPAVFKVLSSSLHLEVLLFSVCQTRLSHQVLPLFITFEIHSFQNYVLPSRFPDLSPEDPFLPLKLFLLWRDLDLLDLFLQMRFLQIPGFICSTKEMSRRHPSLVGYNSPFYSAWKSKCFGHFYFRFMSGRLHHFPHNYIYFLLTWLNCKVSCSAEQTTQKLQDEENFTCCLFPAFFF